VLPACLCCTPLPACPPPRQVLPADDVRTALAELHLQQHLQHVMLQASLAGAAGCSLAAQALLDAQRAADEADAQQQLRGICAGAGAQQAEVVAVVGEILRGGGAEAGGGGAAADPMVMAMSAESEMAMSAVAAPAATTVASCEA
jgi:hypothetical protein